MLLFSWSEQLLYKRVSVVLDHYGLSLNCSAAFAPVLLEREAKRIRNSLAQDNETGSAPKVVRSVYETEDRS